MSKTSFSIAAGLLLAAIFGFLRWQDSLIAEAPEIGKGGIERSTPRPPAVTLIGSSQPSRGDLDRLLAIKNSEERLEALRRFFSELSSAALLNCIPRMNQMAHEANPDEFAAFLEALGNVDGPAAIEYAERIDPEMRFGTPTAAALTGWAGANPSDAVEWCRSRFAGHGFNPFSESLFTGWVAKDPEAAKAAAVAIEHPLERERALRAILFSATLSGEEHDEWIGSLQHDETRHTAHALNLERIAEASPLEAFQRLEAFHPSTPITERGASLIMDELVAGNTPAQIETWLSRHRDTGRWVTLGESWIRKTAGENPNAIASWLGELPVDAREDQFVERFVAIAAPLDPPAIAMWANEIEDPELRRLSVGSALIEWLEIDEESALAWMNQSGYSNVFEMMVPGTVVENQQP